MVVLNIVRRAMGKKTCEVACGGRVVERVHDGNELLVPHASRRVPRRADDKPHDVVNHQRAAVALPSRSLDLTGNAQSRFAMCGRYVLALVSMRLDTSFHAPSDKLPSGLLRSASSSSSRRCL